MRRIEPYRIKIVEPIAFTSRTNRARALEDAGWNLFGLPSSMVTIDLLTDSGFTAMSARQWAAMLEGDESYAGASSFERLRAVVRGLTGMSEVIPAHQGRAAERLLFEAIVRPGDLVPGNTHFDTTRANLEHAGALALDLPVAAVRQPGLEAPWKGDIDLAALERLLDAHPGRVPLVILTVTSNGCGGQPVSLDNLGRARDLCRTAGVPLWLDAARFAENAWFIREREAGQAERSPAAIARSMFDLADGCLMSAKKDGLVNMGGFLALRDPKLSARLRRDLILGEGFPTYGGLAGRDLEAMARGLEEVLEPSYLEDRIAQVRTLGDALHGAGIAIVRPVGGHAVYIDARAFAPHLEPLDLPGQALACALYLHAGIRTVEIGQLMRGSRGADGDEQPVDTDLVRLAIPRRVYTPNHLAYVAEAVCEVHEARASLAPLEIVEQAPALRHFTARLRPRLRARAGQPERHPVPPAGP
jgi:tyrosine phenol-lyase